MKMDFYLSTTGEYAAKMALSSLLEKARESVFDDFIVIVPETKTLKTERFLLENSARGAFANIYVYSFNRLLRKIQTTKTIPLSKEAGVMIVRNLIMQLSGNLNCYKKTAGTVGFAENIYETIQQLKSSGISPIELSDSASKVSTALKIKLKDIALIYDAYENYLGENLVDPNDKLEMLEKEAILSDFVKNANIYVLNFDSITSNVAGVVKTFVKCAKSVTVSASFVHPDKANSHIADNEVFNHFRAIADEVGIKYDPVFKDPNIPSDFSQIKNQLYAYPVKPVKSQDSILLFGSFNINAECEKVASLIKSKVLSGERRYNDSFVYLANEDYVDAVCKAFDRFEIPYFVSEPFQFENHQFFILLKTLFSVVKKNFDAEDVLKFARCGLLFLNQDEVDDFENYVIKYGTNHNKFLKPFVYQDGSEQTINAEKVRQQIIQILTMFLDGFKESASASEIVKNLRNFFDKFDILTRLEKLQKKEEELCELRHAEATKQVYEKAGEVFDMLDQFLGSSTLTMDQFYTLLISGLSAADISLLPLGVDQVQIVTSPDGIYDVKDLYILGATDGNFPKREHDLGLISDTEIVSLEGINEKKIEPTIRTINRRERFAVYELLQLPKESLTISFADRLFGGEEAKMSSLVQSISSLFESEGEGLPIYRFDTPYKEDEDVSLKDFAESLGSIQNAENFLASAFTRKKLGKKYSVGFDKISTLYMALKDVIKTENLKAFEEINIPKEQEKLGLAKELFFQKGRTSISELENYFSCPFKHFCDFGLKLKDRERSSMRALDVGDIMHAVAEKFVNFAVKNASVNVDKFAVNTLEKVLADENYSADDNMVLIKMLRSEVVRLCRALKQEIDISTFKTVATEQWFGGDGKLKGIVINDNPKVEIVGKIDRIDQTSDFYRLIDYKTGKIEAAASDIYYGVKLQLAIYLNAVEDIKRRPAGALYFPIHNEFADGKDKVKDLYKMRGFILSEPDAILKMDNSLSFDNPKSQFIFPSLSTSQKNKASGEIVFKESAGLLGEGEIASITSYAKALVSLAVKEILDGYITPTPYKTTKFFPCKYCSYKNVCGILSFEYKTAREPEIDNIADFYKGGKLWQTK
ncbi:MAG: PD-(D/E)XK nuclease family protein [Clostridia bacterium]|nr:PD-(D/E)XK nuclease family protein [Clostridia bacterium]